MTPSKEPRDFASAGASSSPEPGHCPTTTFQTKEISDVDYDAHRTEGGTPRRHLAGDADAHPLLWRRRLSDFPGHVSLRRRLCLGIHRAQDRGQGRRNAVVVDDGPADQP